MRITKNNYEVYFIDYYDGNLDAEHTAELFYFLETNSDLKEEFNNFSTFGLDVPEIQFPNRDSLKKSDPVASVNDEKLISLLEGDISTSEKESLSVLIQSNDIFSRNYNLFKSTVSVPDLSITFPEKKSLKRTIPFWNSYRSEIRYGIAAVLLLAFLAGVVTVFNRVMEQSKVQVAEDVPSLINKQTSGIHSEDTIPVQNQAIEEVHKTSSKTNSKFAEKSILNKSEQPVAAFVDSAKSSGQENKVILSEPIASTDLPVSQDTIAIVNLHDGKKNAAQQQPSNSNNQYMTVWQALRESSEKNLKKILAKEEPVLALAEETETSKTRIVDVVSKGLQKVSNDKVKLDSDKDSKRFSFSAGNFKIERK